MAYLIDPRRISHERLADEVIIIDVTSGAYYAGSGPAADLWSLIAQGASNDEAASLLASTYGCDRHVAMDQIDSCIENLVTRGVLQLESDTGERPANLLTLPDMARGAWAAPVFQEHLDMWDLIQLDPIHDVGEAGWPFAAPLPRT